LIFTLGFDQNEEASWIKERIHALLVEGIQNRIKARATEISRADYIKKITSWRRNFDKNTQSNSASSFGKLRTKIGMLRAATGKHSRKFCTNLTCAIISGKMTYQEAVAKFN
jgi:hypothetical protein